jgi:hypothetical protein
VPEPVIFKKILHLALKSQERSMGYPKLKCASPDIGDGETMWVEELGSLICRWWYRDGLKGNPVKCGNGPAAVILCPVRRLASSVRPVSQLIDSSGALDYESLFEGQRCLRHARRY